MMHGQKSSQHRLQAMRQKRHNYYAQKPASHSVQPSAGGRRNLPLRHKQAPFSTKQFVEDMQKREQDPGLRTSDRLPKIAYKNEPRQSPALADANLSFQPATRQVHLTEQPLPRRHKA